MNKRKIILVLSLIIAVIFLVVSLRKDGSGRIVKFGGIESGNIGSTATPTLIPTPTPFPIIINSSSNLVNEVDSLSPESFSTDFKFLREEISKF